MAELADAQASGACGSNIVWVQVPFPALHENEKTSAISWSFQTVDKEDAAKLRFAASFPFPKIKFLILW